MIVISGRNRGIVGLINLKLQSMGWARIIKLEMEARRQNFLEISYDTSQGLKLSWDFKDLEANTKYFRHILVICDDNQEMRSSLLESFYKNMKYGDLYCFLYPAKTYLYKLSRWNEKTQIHSFRPKRQLRQLSLRALEYDIKQKLIEVAGEEAKEFNEPVLINFLLGEKDDPSWFYEQVLKQRLSLHQTYKYIVNIFHPSVKSKISTHRGINFFGIYSQNIEDYMNYYHKFVNAAAVEMAHISIEAVDGEITLANESHWCGSDFNRIEATYYGPSNRYQYDRIYFYQLQQSQQTQEEFIVRLSIKLFSGKLIESAKRMKITFNKIKERFATFQLVKGGSYFPEKSICLSQNPNRCEVVARFKSSRAEKQNV